MNPEIPDWYITWAADHAVAFEMNEASQKTLLAWGPLFSTIYLEADLRAATTTLLGSKDCPRFSGDQRPHLLAAVQASQNARRRIAERNSRTADDPTRRCVFCNEIGFVSVPHPGLDGNGRLCGFLPGVFGQSRAERHAVMSVACRCDRGSKVRADSEEADRPILRFEDYDLRYPNWQTVVEDRAEIDRLEGADSTPSRSQVSALQTLVDQTKRLASRTRA